MGYRVISVDWDKKFNADIHADIRKWNYWEWYEPHDFEIVAASPPCTEYSTAMTTRKRKLRQADALVSKAREIIEYFDPPLWWIENPRHGMLKNRKVVQDLHYVDLDYCMFEDFGYKKPTRFWVSASVMAKVSNVTCNGECLSSVEGENGKMRHRLQISGKNRSVSREQAYRIPKRLIQYLCGHAQEPGVMHDSVSADHVVQEVTIRPWHHKPWRPFRVGRMYRKGGCCQLMLEVDIEVAGVQRRANALVDTGAQTSLVRRD